MNETEFFIKLKDSQNNITAVKSLIFNQKEKFYEGELLHSSKTRVCFINGEKKTYISSGDWAFIFENNIYVKGRIMDSSVKINGKLTDLMLLEMVLL